MFSMPMQSVPSQAREGCSDENPIQLFGESVERFRALLSVIYDLYVLALSDEPREPISATNLPTFAS